MFFIFFILIGKIFIYVLCFDVFWLVLVCDVVLEVGRYLWDGNLKFGFLFVVKLKEEMKFVEI